MLLKTVLLTFPNVLLRPHEIGRFRGFLNERLGWQESLFHNHTQLPNGVMYRYPRVQYRVVDNKAALFGIQEGYEALQEVLLNRTNLLPEAFWQVDNADGRHELALSDTLQHYSVYQWLGLNTIRNRDGSITDLETIWLEMTDDESRKTMLARILTAQLLKFCGEMGCRLPQGQLQVNLNEATETGLRTLASATGKNRFRSFRLQYSTNLMLPDHVAFGKGVSKGYGWQVRDRPH